jgi:hypothetical protein
VSVWPDEDYLREVREEELAEQADEWQRLDERVRLWAGGVHDDEQDRER